MKVLKWFGLIVLLLVVLLFIISLFLPSKFKFEANASIKAPSSIVYNMVADYNNWSDWDPWNNADTAMINDISGKPGIGQKRVWKSKTQGDGEMTILELEDAKMVKGELRFANSKKPAYDNWKFEEKDSFTSVNWVVEGETGFNPIVKFMMIFSKKTMNKFLEKGLENLKAASEIKAINETPKIPIVEKEIQAVKYLTVRKTLKMEELEGFFGASYGAIMAFLGKNKIQPAGYPIALYRSWEMEKGIMEVEAGIPVPYDFKLNPPKDINLIEIPAGKVVSAIHFGAYNKIRDVWTALEKYIEDKKYEINGSPWEGYITDPAMEADTNKWQTEVVYPVK